jgi:hypothetical protein
MKIRFGARFLEMLLGKRWSWIGASAGLHGIRLFFAFVHTGSIDLALNLALIPRCRRRVLFK